VQDGRLVPTTIESSTPLLANRGLAMESPVATELESAQ
jgi:hypothetical protein